MVFHIVILSYGMSDNEPVISKYCRLFDLFIELTFRCSEMCKGIPKGNVYHNTAHGSPQNRVTFLVSLQCKISLYENSVPTASEVDPTSLKIHVDVMEKSGIYPRKTIGKLKTALTSFA